MGVSRAQWVVGGRSRGAGGWGLGVAVGASKLVSPSVPPEQAASLRAEAVLRRLLRRLSQHLARATVGPRHPPAPACPLYKVLAGTQQCLGPSVPTQGPGSHSRGELAPWPPTSCPHKLPSGCWHYRWCQEGTMCWWHHPSSARQGGVGGHVTVWWFLAFPSQRLTEGRAAGWPAPSCCPPRGMGFWGAGGSGRQLFPGC